MKRWIHAATGTNDHWKHEYDSERSCSFDSKVFDDGVANIRSFDNDGDWGYSLTMEFDDGRTINKTAYGDGSLQQLKAFAESQFTRNIVEDGIFASEKLSADNFADYYSPDYFPEYDPKRLSDASKIDWYIGIEDPEFVIDDVKDFPDLSVIKEVRYFDDDYQAWADDNGWDGGYNVRYRDGSTKQFAWHMGSSRMYELSPDEYDIWANS